MIKSHCVVTVPCVIHLVHGSVEVQTVELMKAAAWSMSPSTVSLPGMVVNCRRMGDGSSDELVHPQHAYDLEAPSGQGHGVAVSQSKEQQS